jgi:hypothetical protein
VVKSGLPGSPHPSFQGALACDGSGVAAPLPPARTKWFWGRRSPHLIGGKQSRTNVSTVLATSLSRSRECGRGVPRTTSHPGGGCEGSA